MNRGDAIARTVGGATQSVTLPPINMNHLLMIRVEGGRVSGFHILPRSAVTISSIGEITLPVGSIPVVDSAGSPIAGAKIKLTPLRVPADEHDAFEARVEILDSAGSQIAYAPAKAFYPQGWTEVQIQQAIYSAYVQHYKDGGVPLFPAHEADDSRRGQALDARLGASVLGWDRFDWDCDGVSGPRTEPYFK